MDAGYPCQHDERSAFSYSVGERKLMEHFVGDMAFFRLSMAANSQKLENVVRLSNAEVYHADLEA